MLFRSDLQKAIARAAARLAQKRGEILDKSLFEAGASPEDPKRMANLRELQECIDELERLLSYYEDLISDRSNRFIRVNPAVFTFHPETAVLQVGQEPAFGFVVGVGNIVARHGLFARDLALACHRISPLNNSRG